MIDSIHLTSLIELLEHSDLSFKSEFFMKSSDYRYPRIDCGAKEDWIITDSNYKEFIGATGTVKSTFNVEVFKRLVASNDFYRDISYNDCYSINAQTQGSIDFNNEDSNKPDWRMTPDTYFFVRDCVDKYYHSDFYYDNPSVNAICEEILSEDDIIIDATSHKSYTFYAKHAICSPVTSAIMAQYPYIDFFTHLEPINNYNNSLTRTNNGDLLYDASGNVLMDYGMKYMEVSGFRSYDSKALKNSNVFHKILFKNSHIIDHSIDGYMKLRGYRRSLSNVSSTMFLTPKKHYMSVEESKAYIKLYRDAMILRFKELIRIYGSDITLNDLQIMKNVYSKKKMESAHSVQKLLNCKKLKEMVLGLHEMTTLKNEISGEPLYRYPWNMYI